MTRGIQFRYLELYVYESWKVKRIARKDFVGRDSPPGIV